MARITLLDLTAAQVEDIEKAVELPLNRWQAEAPKAQLYVLILAASTGQPVETYRAMKMRDLIPLVSIDAADGDDDNPTPPSER